ncbi:MAG: proline--tRNA ligase [Candidatus Omnitrophica bacterium]|nr:proline--tRNA ligase [Candidatus Omnitrophota bacterium]MBU1047833.1 proline--tRNA ligase [Candidatus Omnitrophota bacterium]MBU1888455.1 proline--tRNA ligase [Candidatus Omnitrophota bacterium]
MRLSKSFINTLRETPKDAITPSHQLMLRAGLVRQSASGLYTYLPFGLRAIQKAINIVREEMDKADALELSLSILQPASLWKKSGRWEQYGKEMMRLQDRKDNFLCIGPTHEEMITDLISQTVRSYKQLPITLYQIKSKFRDEIRPRFGMIRCREFTMKDAYSFDVDEQGLEESYQKMYETYKKIFSRCGLDFEIVEADPGLMGGNFSHEFIAPSQNGEDTIIKCAKCSYRANLEMAECLPAKVSVAGGKNEEIRELNTPGIKTVEELNKSLKIPVSEMIKTLIFEIDNKKFVAALVRGDHEVNPAKLKRLLATNILEMASAEQIEKVTGAPVGFSGPIGLKEIKIVCDSSILSEQAYLCGANKKDKHLTGVNPGKDFSADITADIRYIIEEDSCPKCGDEISFTKGIELGHIFKLGTKYSVPLQAKFIGKDNKENPIIMGCYGIGIDRIIAVAIEQNHDKDGVIFPTALAPYQVLILPTNYKDEILKKKADEIYNTLIESSVEVLIDDRDETTGVKFKDAHLLGIPLIVVLGRNFIEKGEIELEVRGKEKEIIKEKGIVNKILAHLKT